MKTVTPRLITQPSTADRGLPFRSRRLQPIDFNGVKSLCAFVQSKTVFCRARTCIKRRLFLVQRIERAGLRWTTSFVSAFQAPLQPMTRITTLSRTRLMVETLLTSLQSVLTERGSMLVPLTVFTRLPISRSGRGPLECPALSVKVDLGRKRRQCNTSPHFPLPSPRALRRIQQSFLIGALRTRATTCSGRRAPFWSRTNHCAAV